MVADPQAAVQALITARGAGGKAALQTLLAQAAEADPATAAVVQLLAQRDAAPQEDENKDDAAAARQEAVARRRSAVARVRGQLENLADSMAALEARDAQLAHALGACPMCWGQEASCPVCKGAGRVGWRMPDQPLFETLIQPAVRRLMTQRIRQTVGAAPRLVESQTTTP